MKIGYGNNDVSIRIGWLIDFSLRPIHLFRDETGMTVSQVTDEVLYTGLIEMQEMDELEE